MSKIRKLIWGGLFIILLTVQAFTGFDIGGLLGVGVTIDPATGETIVSNPQKLLFIVNALAGLFGIYQPKNEPSA